MSASNSIRNRLNAAKDFLAYAAATSVVAEHKIVNLMRRLCDVAYFYRALAVQFRFGHISRAPLRLLRLELRGNVAECDWVARLADPWDADIPRPVSDRHASLQALEDAIDVRNLFFSVLQGVNTAEFRVYREYPGAERELIIAGTVSREQPAARSVRSLAMRAKLIGLQFWIKDGILEAFQPEECAMSSMSF